MHKILETVRPEDAARMGPGIQQYRFEVCDPIVFNLHFGLKFVIFVLPLNNLDFYNLFGNGFDRP
jgi:hypothetical protein